MGDQRGASDDTSFSEIAAQPRRLSLIWKFLIGLGILVLCLVIATWLFWGTFILELRIRMLSSQDIMMAQVFPAYRTQLNALVMQVAGDPEVRQELMERAEAEWGSDEAKFLAAVILWASPQSELESDVYPRLIDLLVSESDPIVEAEGDWRSTDPLRSILDALASRDPDLCNFFARQLILAVEWGELSRAAIQSHILPENSVRPVAVHSLLDPYIKGLRFLPDNQRLLLQSESNTVVLNALSGRVLWSSPWGMGKCEAFAVSPDGSMALLGGSTDRPWARLLDTATGRVVHEFELPGSAAGEVAFSPDGSVLYTVGFYPESPVIAWSADTFEELRRLTGPAAHVEQIEPSPDGRHLLAFAREGLHLWDLAASDESTLIPGTEEVALWNFGSEGETAIGLSRSLMHVVDLESHTVTERDLSEEGFMPRLGDSAPEVGLALTPMSNRFLALWDLDTLEVIQMCHPGRNVSAHMWMVTNVDISPNGRLAASRGMSGELAIHELPDLTARVSSAELEEMN